MQNSDDEAEASSSRSYLSVTPHSQSESNRFDDVPVALAILDGNLTIEYANEACISLLQRSKEELQGMRFQDLFAEYPELRIFEDIRSSRLERQSKFDLLASTPSHQPIWLRVTYDTRDDRDGVERVQVILQNISGLKEKEREHRRQILSMHSALNKGENAEIRVTAQGEILAVSDTALEMLGYSSKNELLGRPIHKVLKSKLDGVAVDEAIRATSNSAPFNIRQYDEKVTGVREDGTRFEAEVYTEARYLTDHTEYILTISNLEKISRLEKEHILKLEKHKQELGLELHDTVGQYLCGLNMIAHNLIAEMRKNKMPMVDKVSEITSLIKDIDDKIHLISNGHIAEDVRTLGLTKSIEAFKEWLKKIFKVDCKLNLSPSIKRITVEHAKHILRIIQEATTNSIKHGSAKTISISLTETKGTWRLTVEDDGIGFDSNGSTALAESYLKDARASATDFSSSMMSKDRGTSSGLGIQSMMVRADHLKGKLELLRTAKKTTILKVEFPDPRVGISNEKESFAGHSSDPGPNLQQTPESPAEPTLEPHLESPAEPTLATYSISRQSKRRKTKKNTPTVVKKSL